MAVNKPLSNRARWALVVVVTACHPILLFALYPVVGEAINTIVLAGPITATLLFGIRVGVTFIIINAMVSGLAFWQLTGMEFVEGMPKAFVSLLVMAVVCLGTDRLRHFIDQRRAMEAALRQAQKMEAIGRLAGGVAHDINNTLNAIMGCAFALRHELSVYGRSFPDLDNIAVACDRGAQLTRNLLGFARRSCDQEQAFSLNAVVQRVQTLLTRTVDKNIRVAAVLAEPPPFMVGDQGQIEEAVMNLCLNSVDAINERGTLTITTFSKANHVSLSVSDTGTGMNDNVRERAFEPFFTTKPPGKGTGLGLSMVYGTVQAMHGSISLHTAEGVGTEITLTFPKGCADSLEPTADRVSVEGPSETELLRARTVLLVDDEPLVLRAGVRMLRAMGCEVLSAKGGREGLEIFRTNRHTIALVIVDLIMPEMDGSATVQEILAVAPQTPVLLASGYASEFAKLQGALRELPTVAFLAKPYDARQLVAAAGKLLPRTQGSPTESGKTGTE